MRSGPNSRLIILGERRSLPWCVKPNLKALKSSVQPLGMFGLLGLIGLFGRIVFPLCTGLWQQCLACERDFGHRQCRERTGGVFGQSAIAHLVQPLQAFDHAGHMPDACLNVRIRVRVRVCDFARLTELFNFSVKLLLRTTQLAKS